MVEVIGSDVVLAKKLIASSDTLIDRIFPLMSAFGSIVEDADVREGLIALHLCLSRTWVFPVLSIQVHQ